MEDQSGLQLLADVCVYQQWVWSAPLIPLDFPRKERSLMTRRRGRIRTIGGGGRKTTTRPPLILKISQTGLGKRCHFKVDNDEYDLKGKKKTKQGGCFMGCSDIASTSYGMVDPRVENREFGSDLQSSETSHLKMLMGPNPVPDPDPNPSPNPPRLFMERIQELGGSEGRLVMEKTLSVTDLKKDQNRLSMPFQQIQSDFLTSEEKLVLNTMEDNGRHCRGIDVMVIQPSLSTSTLRLKKWDYKSSSFSYVFIKNWSNLASDNGLEPGMVLQIWSFRVDNALCFALVNLSQERPAIL